MLLHPKTIRLMCDYCATGLWGLEGSLEYDDLPTLTPDTIQLLQLWQKWFDEQDSHEEWNPTVLADWHMLRSLIYFRLQRELPDHSVIIT